ncbi:hypothetical protein EK21DRAFT_86041 [Setomelanomma holmii]|uniref:Uncharacterized protein n=1 Tax=Setomelanomma holmii TaxID=210430 RepID=A0A9P4HIL5_9PLEO|nr:hypothetical protein EK21DRAFT_86041 [Setomelanomma holmii]
MEAADGSPQAPFPLAKRSMSGHIDGTEACTGISAISFIYPRTPYIAARGQLWYRHLFGDQAQRYATTNPSNTLYFKQWLAKRTRRKLRQLISDGRRYETLRLLAVAVTDFFSKEKWLTSRDLVREDDNSDVGATRDDRSDASSEAILSTGAVKGDSNDETTDTPDFPPLQDAIREARREEIMYNTMEMLLKPENEQVFKKVVEADLVLKALRDITIEAEAAESSPSAELNQKVDHSAHEVESDFAKPSTTPMPTTADRSIDGIDDTET